MTKKKTIIISLAILVAAGIITAIIFLTEPTANKSGATKETAMLVDVVKADSGNFQPTIKATGIIEPARDIMLSTRVSGQIVNIAKLFTPGGFVKEGEMLVQIDPSDFRNELLLRKSELQQALADLKIEQGRQEVAEQDYELFDDTLTSENKSLVLREPQLNAVEASVTSARAAVQQAQLNLNRSTVSAPFDARIITRNVNVGSQVNIGDNLARLVGTNNFWLSVTIPLDKLPFISIPDEIDEKGAKVKIKNPSSWPEGEYREGYLFQMVGTMEEETRMARVLIRIPDPLNTENKKSDKPEIIIGSFLEAEITGDLLEGVVKLDRAYVREDETVWVMKEGKLEIRKVNVTFFDANYAYINDGIHQGDKIVTTNLATITEGAELRTQSKDSVTNKDSELQNTGGGL